MSFNLKILNFAKGQELPVFKENRNGKWIDYGAMNDYPSYLLNVYHNYSNKHKAIINRKVQMATGAGFENLTPEQIEWNKNIWSEHTVDELITKAAYDLEIYGGFAIGVRWNRDGSTIAALDYIPYQKCRLSPCEKKILISKDWSNWRRSECKPEERMRLNPDKAGEHPSQVYYYHVDTVGGEYYPIPYYSSTLCWIELDYEVSNFHLSSVRNGFMPGFILNFSTGIPTLEEMEMAYREFEKKYTGSENAGKFILTFSEGQDQKPELIPINLNDSDDRFIMLRDSMRDEIFIGHSVTNPQLFGIRVPGELGGKDELLESLAIFQSTYVSIRQRQLEKCFTKLMNLSGIDGEIKLKKYEIDFGEIVAQEQQFSKQEDCNCQKMNEDEGPCWDGYQMVGMKEVDGRRVPNCVPIKE
jgi:hypothetical protein